MNHGIEDSGRRTSSSAQRNTHFIWPLGKSLTTPDEMITSYGPRIDTDRGDLHDGTPWRTASCTALAQRPLQFPTINGR